MLRTLQIHNRQIGYLLVESLNGVEPAARDLVFLSAQMPHSAGDAMDGESSKRFLLFPPNWSGVLESSSPVMRGAGCSRISLKEGANRFLFVHRLIINLYFAINFQLAAFSHPNSKFVHFFFVWSLNNRAVSQKFVQYLGDFSNKA